MNISKLKALFSLYNEAELVRAQQLGDFMDFYKILVQIVPPEAARQFGTMDVSVYVYRHKAVKNYGINLTVVDYAWWVEEFKANNCYFVEGPARVKQQMLERITSTVEQHLVSPEHKKALLELLVGE